MSSRRRSTNSVVAGSIWESRMKSDEVKGGIKVFNGGTQLENNAAIVTKEEQSSTKMVVLKKAQTVGVVSGKRKTWKSESLEGSIDGIKKSPRRSEITIPRSPIPLLRKTTTESCKEIVVSKVKSESVKKIVVDIQSDNDDVKNSVQLSTNSDHRPIEKSESEQCKEFGVCEEKIISTSIGIIEKSADEDDDLDDFEDEDEFDEEIHVDDEEIEKQINLPEEPKPSNAKLTVCDVNKPNSSKVVKKKFHQLNDRSAPASSSVNKQAPPPLIKKASVYQNSTPPDSDDQYQRFPQTQNSKLQNLVDLVMWRDISRSAFIFGIGTFSIISSSYTQDLNISFISVISYLGLVYLATIFLYRSILCRGIIDIDDDDDDDDRNYVLGEGEAIWLIKLVLPYLNEALLKLKALFSGDPATTMKLAVLLFVLARCGNSITIWKMVKLGFFGVFTVPKVCSSYSAQLTAYGKFWIRRFKDAWNSCAHKKAVAIGAFTLMWNLSSMVARIWAVFLLFVAFRLYHQSKARDDWDQEEDGVELGVDDHQQQPSQQTLKKPIKVPGPGPTILAANKIKKGF